MPLTFTDRKWHDETTGTVTFPGWSGSQRVTCRITDEALKAVFGAGPSPSDLVETFERCRASIEAAAAKKFETDGSAVKLVLVIGDFETRAPAKPEPKPQSAAEAAEMMKRFRANGTGRSVLHSDEIDTAVAALQQETDSSVESESETA